LVLCKRGSVQGIKNKNLGASKPEQEQFSKPRAAKNTNAASARPKECRGAGALPVGPSRPHQLYIGNLSVLTGSQGLSSIATGQGSSVLGSSWALQVLQQQQGRRQQQQQQQRP
jgi:hypothetical protein